MATSFLILKMSSKAQATKFRNGKNENGFLQLRSVSDIFNATTEFSRKRNSRNFGKSFGCIGSETEKIGTEFFQKTPKSIKHVEFETRFFYFYDFKN